MFSDHSSILLELKNKNISGKCLNIWYVNNTFLIPTDQRKISKGKLENVLTELNENENVIYQSLGMLIM